MKTLRTKIFAYFLLPVIVVELAVFITFRSLVESAFHHQVESEAAINLRRISAGIRDLLIAKNYDRLTLYLFDEKYAGSNTEYLAVFDSQGQLVKETALNATFSGMPAVARADSGNVSHNISYRGEELHVLDSPIYVGLSRIGFIRVAHNFEAAEEDFHQALDFAIGVGIFFMLVVTALAFRLSRDIIRPVENLSRVSKEFAGGKLAARAKAETNDELGTLANDFNNMADSLALSSKSLVAEKKKLQEKINELEAWQSNTIDRELKMVELKKEIKELKDRMKDQG